MTETTGQEVDIAQLEAKIAQLAEEKRAAHDAVASCEYQLDTKRTFTFQSATEEERAWYGKTRYCLLCTFISNSMETDNE